MPEIFSNNPNANVELNKYFPQEFSFVEILNNLINYVKSLPIEPTAEILNKIEALENEFLTVKQASEDATADVTELTGKYVSLLHQVTTLAVNVSGFTEKTESIDNELNGIQENITAIKNKNTEQDNSIAGINQEISGINEDISHNDEEILNIQQEITNIKNIQRTISYINCVILNNNSVYKITQEAFTNLAIIAFRGSMARIIFLDMWHLVSYIDGNTALSVTASATNEGNHEINSEITISNNSGSSCILFVVKFHQ